MFYMIQHQMAYCEGSYLLPTVPPTTVLHKMLPVWACVHFQLQILEFHK